MASDRVSWNCDMTEIRKPHSLSREPKYVQSLSALSAGIAHQLKNPLFAISATIDAFERRFAAVGEQKRYFEVMRDSVHRLNELANQLTEYGDPEPLVKTSCDAEQIMQEAAKSCEEMASKAHVRIVHRTGGQLPLIQMDRARMQDAFRYLLQYSLSRSQIDGAIECRAHETSVGGCSFVECVLEDCGDSISNDELPNMFQPFFKHDQVGADLRLAIAAMTVRLHGGELRAEQVSDSSGIRFLVRLAQSGSREWA